MDLQSKYKKLDHRDHVLARPGMYIGSIEEDSYNTWVYDEDTKTMVKKDIKIVPGLYKIFDEILVNAIDHATRTKMEREKDETVQLVKNIRVTLDKETGSVCITNDGDGIEVELHPEHNVYVPELIFGHLLTSTNYDDTEEKIIGGQNGLGSKCIGKNTMVPMFDGTIKQAKHINIGDQLIGDDGTVRTVLHKICGKSTMFEVTQARGESYTVNEDHILTLQMPDHKLIFWDSHGWKILWWDKEANCINTKYYPAYPCQQSGNSKRHCSRTHQGVPWKPPTKTPDTNNGNVRKAFEEVTKFAESISNNNVFDISIKDYMSLDKATQSRLAGVRGACVDWSYKAVELDPYVLGLWLGDGASDYLNAWLEQTGNHYRENGCAHLKMLLEKYDLVRNKHIPTDYIVNSRDVRLKVLAGLIDTDGKMRDGTHINITQGIHHERLARDIVHLVRSLGFYCTMRTRKVYFRHNNERKSSMAYSINISGNIGTIPTLLPRKRCINTKAHNNNGSCGQISVRELEVGDYVGLKIDGNERFVINDFTVTHNCTNIFSKSFNVETVDARRKRIYQQEFTNNMSKVSEPVIKYCAKKPYTSITFLPDYERFKLPRGMNGDVYNLFVKRTFDVCALTDNDVNVWLNGVKLEYKNFERYVDLYIGDKKDKQRVYEKLNDRWEIVATSTDVMGFEQVSFVNGIWTIRGGKHVDYIANQIVSQLCEMINKRRKGADIKPQHIKSCLMLFIKSTITNPTFDSQTKDLLTTPVSKFGSKAEIVEKFVEKLYKSDIVERALALSEVNAQKNLKKTDGKKANKIRGLVKLDDANLAGTARSRECTLILTEGDSAKSMALSGLAVVGRDLYGVFPLRGKLLNVKDVTAKKLMENEEIQNIKKIMGLESGKKYNDIGDLRYGRIMIMSDQDHDGSHIRGLIMNMFETLWPSLVKKCGFLVSLLTPIIKATNKTNRQQLSFYNMTAFNKWHEETGDISAWDIKYYKGLGTSTEEEAKEYFRTMHQVTYDYSEDCEAKLDLAFNKKRSDDRKLWLNNYDPSASLDYEEENEHVTYTDFIDKELIHFSVYDVKRSIPSMVDGLKPSQRKILYSCFKRNLVKEIKVAQLSAYVSETSAYHHGDASLQAAIICMAQDFVGSNNINLLKPNGQFGNRVMGGKNAAAPRYIFTELEKIAFNIFRKEDANVLKYLDDDGMPVEPEYYVPIIPMALVNSCIGIGTGFSTSIPAFNPLDIVSRLKWMLENNGSIEFTDKLVPWYRGFEGTIEPIDEKYNTFVSRGIYVRNDDKSLEVLELPVGTWTEDYKAFLEDYLEKNPKVLKDYQSYYTTTKVRFVLSFAPGELDKLLENKDAFEKEFKLSSRNITTTNMHLFDSRGIIHKYANVEEVFADFYKVRYATYEKRIALLITELENDITKVSSKAKFVLDVCNGSIKVMGASKQEVTCVLEGMGYPKYDGNYNYLINMPIYSLTKEKQEQLLKELADMEALLEEYNTTTVKDIWMKELLELEGALDGFGKNHAKKMVEEDKNKGSKKKVAAKRVVKK